MNKEQLQTYAKQAGADIFGVANIERFDELPGDKHPRAIFPETKSVIIIGRRITRGTLRGVEEGTNFQSYALYGWDWLVNRFLGLTTFKIAEFIEDNQWEAVPLPNLPTNVPPMGVPVRKGAPAANVMLDFDDAAVRAGVGEIGYCGFLLTPDFGPRQRIQIILTDAEIEPDLILGKEICLHNQECKGFCPLPAFKEEKSITICGKNMTVADIDYRVCTTCKNGAMLNRQYPGGKPDRIAALCGRSCVDCLEKAGRIGNQFTSQFRKREPWKIIGNEKDIYKL